MLKELEHKGGQRWVHATVHAFYTVCTAVDNKTEVKSNKEKNKTAVLSIVKLYLAERNS